MYFKTNKLRYFLCTKDQKQMENSDVLFPGYELKTGVNFFMVLIALGVIRSHFIHSSIKVQKMARNLYSEKQPNPGNFETAGELFGFLKSEYAFNSNN